MSRCANCGELENSSKSIIAGYDGEWFCSVECEEEHEKLGCPFEIGNKYRIKKGDNYVKNK